MSANFVQGVSAAAASVSVTSAAATLPANATTGDMLVVFATWSTNPVSGGTTAVCTDSQGNTYTSLSYSAGNTYENGQAFYVLPATGGAITVTLTFQTGHILTVYNLMVLEYKDVVSGPATNPFYLGSGFGSSFNSGSHFTSSSSRQTFVGYASVDGGTGSLSAGSGGWVLETSSSYPAAGVDRDVSAAGTYNPHFSGSGLSSANGASVTIYFLTTAPTPSNSFWFGMD